MAKAKRLTVEQVAQALAECRGLVHLTAKKLGASADAVERFVEAHPQVAAVLSQQRGEMVDAAEAKLWSAIQDGQPWAITFALKCLGQGRGYTLKRGGDEAPAPAPTAPSHDDRVARVIKILEGTGS
jgi:hypothetical protein